MKRNWCVILLFTLFLYSCQKEYSRSIEAYSSDKEMKITLIGSRSNSLDSWLIEIELDHGGIQHKVFQEFYADEISRKNIGFEWKTDRACLIHLTQRDGTIITIPIKISSK